MNTEAMLTAAKSFNHVDKVKTLLRSLKEQGVSVKDLETALREEAATQSYDPTKLGQSLDSLISKFKA
jgi:hypothetical protein